MNTFATTGEEMVTVADVAAKIETPSGREAAHREATHREADHHESAGADRDSAASSRAAARCAAIAIAFLAAIAMGFPAAAASDPATAGTDPTSVGSQPRANPAATARSTAWPPLAAPYLRPAPLPGEAAACVVSRALRRDYRFPAADDRGYDVQHYDLDLTVTPHDRSIAGTVTIRLRALDELRRVRLDLVDELGVDLVTWNGAAVAYVHEGDSLAVTLPAAQAAGAVGDLAVRYAGRPPRHGSFAAGLLYREHNDGVDDLGPPVPIVASISEPYSSHSWWPCKDHPGDKAPARIAVTAPDTLRVVANGVLVAREAAGPGRERWIWREPSPIAPYLVSIAVTNYAVWSEECPTAGEPVRLEYHVYPQDREDAEIDLAPACAMMTFFSDRFGPYPFAGEKYAQVEVEWIGGMENQTATAIGAFAIRGTGQWESLIAHELVHSWFGNSLTPALWRDIWLNEGFARYGEALWAEHRGGPAAYRAFMHEIGPGHWPELFVGEGLLGDPAPPVLAVGQRLVYDKGAWVLHMLRGFLGDARFFAFLRDYANHPALRLGHTTSADLIAVASESAGEDLAPFFTPWLETDAVPVLETTTEIRRAGFASRVIVRVVQRQEPLFHLRLPVRIHTDSGPIDRSVLVNRRTLEVTWPVPGRATEVELDPDGWLLFRRATQPLPLLRVLPLTPNPVGGGQAPTLHWYLRADARLQVTLYDVRGRRLGHWDLGLQAANAADEESGSPTSWTLPLATAAGRLAAGVYWLEVRAGDSRAIRKWTLLR